MENTTWIVTNWAERVTTIHQQGVAEHRQHENTQHNE
jgi:hypothetical protein